MVNLEIQWFVHFGAERQVFDANTIQQLISITPDGTDLMAFAQAVLDNRLSEDVAAIQALMEDAVKKANEGEVVTAGALDPQEKAAAAQAASAAPAAASASSGYPFDISGFPDFSGVDDANDEEVERIAREFLQHARVIGASDAHLSSKAYPYVRYLHHNYLLKEFGILSPKAAERLNLSLLNRDQATTFKDKWDLDYCCTFSENDRYRANVMKHNDGIEGSYRIIADRIKTLSELGFDNAAVLEKLTTYHQGMILIAGPAGCGKTTTLAAMVELINNARQDHIITVEDPVEILVRSKGCNVSQRELYSSTKSFANALRAALREDPDILIIGEMRDLETIEMAISAAETGHLVIGTLHTNSAADTLDRLLDVFPPDQQPQIRAMLAESLRGVICQFLVPSIDKSRLYLAPEILISNLAVANLIRENKTSQLLSILETGQKKGMILKEDSFMKLYKEGKISVEDTLVNMFSASKIAEVKKLAGIQ